LRLNDNTTLLGRRPAGQRHASSDGQKPKPVVSVVMVICNVERFLREAIESILGQTYRDFEFIILDFGSNDNSKAIAAGYAATDDRITFHQIPHCDVARARNTGCSLAQGRYIAVMDADDVSLPNRLSLEVDFMEKHPEIGLLGGAAEWIDARGRSLWSFNVPLEDQEIKTALRTHYPFSHTSLLVRTEAFAHVGGYRSAFTSAEDYDLALRISDRFQCANLPQIVVKYRIHPNQLSLTKRKQQTLCKLAAQASASSRRSTRKDPLNAAGEITPALLAANGVSEAKQKAEISAEYQCWIGVMSKAGEYRAALKSSAQACWTDRNRDARWQIADFHFSAATFNWEKKRLFRAFLAASNAMIFCPGIARLFIQAARRRLSFQPLGKIEPAVKKSS
jgi:glycosyltransferase involved in cell wall biosynthesis